MIDIKETLTLHAMWTRTEDGGVRANLRGANLSEANLRGANLRGANLRGANLSEANLRWANLSEANLSGANLRWANLRWANLSEANLSGANLSWANLSEANLRGANLSGAVLQESCGLVYAQCSWEDHGQAGRMLTAARIGNDTVCYCGCLRGSAGYLREYIATHEPELAVSRTIAADFVLARIDEMVAARLIAANTR